ncbi:hypothetical protein RF11_13046 [Thelohanellus kitauei]|uniref:Uncharacterized protein n=1 Tax=Thelohanellus kitauei TaxID=669202 RepID=A0A0C2MXB3_THEKT|nr:hypothetical protein RF11_13046 [Thelohanellus kitauei]
MSDRIEAQNVVDKLTRPRSTVIMHSHIYMPGLGHYVISLKKKREDAYFVIKDQKGSRPRIRIRVPICNRAEFLHILGYVTMLADDCENRSYPDNTGTDLDLYFYSTMDDGNGRSYEFEAFVEKYVRYLRITYIHKGIYDTLLFNARYLKEIIRIIQNFDIYHPNRMVAEDYCDICHRWASL